MTPLTGMKVMKKIKPPKINNFVAKHMNTYNKPTTQVDKKNDSRRGYTKHKEFYTIPKE